MKKSVLLASLFLALGLSVSACGKKDPAPAVEEPAVKQSSEMAPAGEVAPASEPAAEAVKPAEEAKPTEECNRTSFLISW